MKLKYKVAMKFYTETRNEQQLDFAYKELDSFYDSYNNFKWYYKFNLDKIKSDYFNFFTFSDLDLKPEVEKLLTFTGNKEFVFFVDRFKYKMADAVFQKSNYNYDLVKYAIDKVIKKQHEDNNNIDINSILNNQKEESKHFIITEETSSDISLWFSFSLVVISIGLIFAHYYMYSKNPIKYFSNFQRM